MFNNFETNFNMLYETYNEIKQELEDAKEKLRTWNKDEEIQKANNEVKYIRNHSLQILSDKEMKAYQEFRGAHWNRCGNSGIYNITLEGTGIGTVIKVRCPYCDEEKDITDIDSW